MKGEDIFVEFYWKVKCPNIYLNCCVNILTWLSILRACGLAKWLSCYRPCWIDVRKINSLFLFACLQGQIRGPEGNDWAEHTLWFNGSITHSTRLHGLKSWDWLGGYRGIQIQIVARLQTSLRLDQVAMECCTYQYCMPPLGRREVFLPTHCFFVCCMCFLFKLIVVFIHVWAVFDVMEWLATNGVIYIMPRFKQNATNCKFALSCKSFTLTRCLWSSLTSKIYWWYHGALQ